MEGPVAQILQTLVTMPMLTKTMTTMKLETNDNNAPAGPNAPPPNQPTPNQPASNQPAPNQPAPNQPAPANPAGPTPSVQPVPNPPQPFPYQPAPQIIHQQMINGSYFKPKFTDRPEEDVEAHLLGTNDWMRTHNFEEDVKVQRFCLTLIEEARLWYETLTPITNDWPTLENNFRWQYSKLGNTPEQYFHQWRSFCFDENTDSIDSYVTKVS